MAEIRAGCQRVRWFRSGKTAVQNVVAVEEMRAVFYIDNLALGAVCGYKINFAIADGRSVENLARISRPAGLSRHAAPE